MQFSVQYSLTKFPPTRMLWSFNRAAKLTVSSSNCEQAHLPYSAEREIRRAESVPRCKACEVLKSSKRVDSSSFRTILPFEIYKCLGVDSPTQISNFGIINWFNSDPPLTSKCSTLLQQLRSFQCLASALQPQGHIFFSMRCEHERWCTKFTCVASTIPPALLNHCYRTDEILIANKTLPVTPRLFQTSDEELSYTTHCKNLSPWQTVARSLWQREFVRHKIDVPSLFSHFPGYISQ